MFHYFGYGSNMSETALRAKGVTPLSAERAVLPGWSLCFNIPNFFLIEGGTGNIVPDPEGSVHGVLYACNDHDLPALDELEALNVAYERRRVTLSTYTGQEFQPYVYVGLKEIVTEGLLPSRRYLNILIQGAQSMGLDPEYVDRLRRTETCLWPRLGRFEFPSEPSSVISDHELASNPKYVALAGAVFDMSQARESHHYLVKLLGGRDVTLFFLRRMDSSDGTESWEQIVTGSLSPLQKDYLNDYLHQFAKEYSYVGKLAYADACHGPQRVSIRPQRLSSIAEIPARRALRTATEVNRTLGHENLGFLSEEHGFMPLAEPERGLPSEFAAWDQLIVELPELHRTLGLRRTVEALPLLDASAEHLPDGKLLRAAAALSMLAHAYWYVETHPPQALPQSLAVPWKQVLKRLDREQAVLSYIDLIVYNWRLVDPEVDQPRRVSNMQLLIPTVDNQEEQNFYLTQTEILAEASPIIGSVVRAQEAVSHDDPQALCEELERIIQTLQRIVRRSLVIINPNPAGPTFVNPVVWAKTVAPFAVPMQKGLQGPSGTSSPIFNLMDIFLGRRKHETFLGKEIRALRTGYPLFWREFLQAVSEVSVPDYVARVGHSDLSGLLKETVDVYSGDNGFLGRHRMKVYGYLEQAFKVGRSVTIGGFAGVFKDRTWNQVDDELERSRLERLESFPKGCHHARVKTVGQTHMGAPEDVKQVVLDVEDSGVRFQPGDRCGILPENDLELVERTLRVLGANGDERIALTPEWRAAARLRAGYENAEELSLRDLLRFGKIRPVTLRLAEALHAASQNPMLLEAIFAQSTTRWELWDLLRELERARYEPKRLLQAPQHSSEYISHIVPPEAFRMYSISSTLEEGATEIRLTVGRVQYSEKHAGEGEVSRRGTASHFLCTAAGHGEPISFMVEHPPRFSLPDDPSVPIVMLAGGTGISPFRAFILERVKQPNAGHCYLFLSIRSPEHLYYREELAHWVSEGKLSVFITCTRADVRLLFRDGPNGGDFTEAPGRRGRIGELINAAEYSSDLKQLLQSQLEGGRGAYFYLCGRSGFARSVQEAFRQLLSGFQEGTEDERRLRADDVMCQLIGEGRFMLEIFTDAKTWDVQRPEFNVSELIQHNDDQLGHWLLIDGLVYDVTSFLRQHPGGTHVLRMYSGMDATQGYTRVHGNHTEVDAQREMYQLGGLRLLNLDATKRTIVLNDKEQTVSLSSLYRLWVKFAYFVVEMQNALRSDQSLQLDPQTGRIPQHRSIYNLQRAVETHERFLRSYVDGMLGEPLRALWQLVDAMCDVGDPEWIGLRVRQMRAANSTRLAEAVTGKLGRQLQDIIAREASEHDLDRLKLSDVVTFLEELDGALLFEIKDQLRVGLELFEQHEATALEHGYVLADGVRAMVESIAEHHHAVYAYFATDSWIPSEIPEAPRRSVPNMNEVKTLVSTSLWLMEEDTERKVVLLRRSANAVESLQELVDQNEKLILNMRPEHRQYGIVVDMREAQSRNDPDFEDAMRLLRQKIARSYARVAVLVTSAVGVLQVNRIGRNEGAETFATQSEDAALRFAEGA